MVYYTRGKGREKGWDKVMKIATLAIIVQNGKVLLGHKKKGEIGTNTLNGPGGKCEPGESLIECVVRETREEVRIELDPTDITETALITFYTGSVPDFEMHVFFTNHFSGTPQETDDMIPGWYDLNNRPLERMLEADRTWFERVARGERLRANAYYRERAKDFERIEFLPL